MLHRQNLLNSGIDMKPDKKRTSVSKISSYLPFFKQLFSFLKVVFSCRTADWLGVGGCPDTPAKFPSIGFPAGVPNFVIIVNSASVGESGLKSIFSNLFSCLSCVSSWQGPKGRLRCDEKP